ncbi:hypothetical protein DYU11_22690 [Fibrisoma montanum]|uniref:Uncharacterized protein n=1 Tax=Fibrisoma montanum TaxID=2305895 RepID=A0A418M2C6_9BACT|nr:hypothetical protein [Fibrisoma montanum]RIV19740.1 hypothetical protein DYU11_22690 [Fibrisoma montanum]
MGYTTIGDSRGIERLVAFNQVRLQQYTERTGQTRIQVIDQLMKAFGRDCNQAAVNALMDPVVDPEYSSETYRQLHADILAGRL